MQPQPERNSQLEDDVSRLFREKVALILRDWKDTCKIAGLERQVIHSILTLETLRIAALTSILFGEFTPEIFSSLAERVYMSCKNEVEDGLK